MAQNSKEIIDIVTMYGNDCISSIDKMIEKYQTSISNGLSEEVAFEKIHKFGLNEIAKDKSKKWYHYFLKSFFSPFNSILLGITVILLFTDVYLATEPNFANIIVICILVLTSTFLDFIQEYKSNRAAEKLKELVSATTTVTRDGKQSKLLIKEITIGDIISLSAGSMIPADLRIIESNNLYVRQSTLTGESDSIKKISSSELSINDLNSLSDLDTICFMGTNVISGSAKGVVIKTGTSTYFGKIADNISKKPKTAFQSGVEEISKLLIKFMLIMIPLVFFINFQKHDLILAFTFAVAIAIGITPLLLPVILSSSLSKAAIKMSKKKTIVKSLDSIQSFGAMNILCTDKTGTLTDDKIVLEKYLDVYGNEDMRILKHAYLNAYFQTGLSSNIDEAILSRIEKLGFTHLKDKYTKIDEIPFDFSRRRLSVIVSDGVKNQLITKGAVEEILNICSFVDDNSNSIEITEDFKNDILSLSKNLNSQGFRVVGIAQKNNISINHKFTETDESEMVLLGFTCFLDPPKESASESITKLNSSGIRVIVLTGDNIEVTRSVCAKLNLNSENILTGSDIDKLHDNAVLNILKKINIFAKLSPIQKSRLVRLLKENGNVVGYMGDGINDSPSLIASDIGISVDTAVDIAKESADIILLEKDLNILLDGVYEGRHTFTNIMKYIKMAISFNFGEVSSVIIASIFLPFLPITPIQLLTQSLLYDFGQLTLPYDNVDKDCLFEPKKWNTKSLKNFMLFMGPLSSSFDIIVFVSLWFIFNIRDVAIFQTVWFSYGVVSNLMGMHIIRTTKVPFLESNASSKVYFSSILLSIVAMIIPFTFLGSILGLTSIPIKYFSIIIGVPILYCFVALAAKKIYKRKYKEWI